MVVKTGGRGPGHVARTPPGPAAAAMTLSGLSTAENSTAGTLIGVLGTVGTTGTPVYALDNNAGGRAALSGTNLNRGATALDYATATFFDVTVSVTGVTPVISPTTFRIAVTPLVDTVPNAFSFTDATGIDLSTVATSNSITVSGINAPSAISVSGGEYERNGSGSWTGSAGTVVNGDTVKVRGTSSASNSTAVNVVLTIGGVSDTYTITTVAAAGGPAFSFTPLAYYDETSVVQTAGAVSQWTDKGPNGLHLKQATGANQPAWDGTSLTLDGVNDALITDPSDLSAKTALCSFARMSPTSSSSSGGVLVMAGDTEEDHAPPGAIFWYRSASSQLTQHRNFAVSITVTPDTNASIGAVYNRSGNDTIYNHDTLETNSAAIDNAAFSSTGRFVLGARRGFGAFGASAAIKFNRLLLIDFVPSAGQLDEIWAWLQPPGTFSFTPLAYYDETSVVQTAGAVSQWTDKGPNGIHLIQATGANQPAWTDWIGFDGVNDTLVSAPRDLSSKPALAAFARIETAPGGANAAADGIFVMGGTAGDDYTGDGCIFFYDPGGAQLGMYRTTGIGTGVSYSADVRLGAVFDNVGLEWIYNKTTGVNNSGTLSNIPFSTTGQFVLGSRWNALDGRPGAFGQFRIKRLVLTDFVPTTPQLDEIWAWLAA